MPPRFFAGAFRIGIFVVAAAAITYSLSREHVHVINVRWRPGTTEQQKQEVRARYGLERCRYPEGRTETCDLLDSTTKNLKAIVEEPLVEDTSNFDRSQLNFPDPRFGEGYTWAAYRVSLLRRPGVLGALWLVALALTIVGGLRHPARRRLIERLNERLMSLSTRLARHPRLSLRDPTIAIGLAAACAVPVLVHAYLGTFTRLMADDYCIASDVRRLGGVVPYATYVYQQWSGRVSTNVLEGYLAFLEPASRRWVPAIAAAALTAALATLIFDSLTTSAARVLRACWAAFLAFFLIAAVFAITPDVRQSLYWVTGLSSNIPPLIGGVLLAILIRDSPRRSRRSRIVSCALIVIIAIVTAAFNETYATVQFAAVAIALVLRMRRTFASPAGPLLCAVFGAITGLAIVALAPGNFVRQQNFSAPPGLIGLSILTAQLAATFVVDVFSRGWAALAVICIACLLFAIITSGDEGVTLPRWLEAYVGVATVLLLLAAFAPSAYAIAIMPPRRTQIIPVFVIVMAVAALGYSLGLRIAAGQRDLNPISGVALLILVIVTTAIVSLQAWRLHRVLGAFARDWDVVDAQIQTARSEGLSTITVDYPADWANMDMPGTDPSFWVNSCISSYYGVQVVSTSSH